MGGTGARGEGWQRYYDGTAGRPPRETLLAALERFPTSEGDPAPRRRAVDLGCGDGRDTIELLRRGWSVLAIDAEAAALERLRARATPAERALLETRCQRFEEATWGEVDLVNASFALPLCAPPDFARLWRRICGSLAPGGRFAGQLYGERDSWAGDPGLTHLTRAAMLDLLAPLAIEHLLEEESDAVTPQGKPKHWHIFHIVARRP